VRVSARQDLISRRISAFAPQINPEVTEWSIAHGDLHWANLTIPKLYILDWEGWGIGPRGLDSATLWAFSLAVPSLAARICQEFAEHFNSRSGKIAQLFMCVELLRMIETFGDHPSLKEPIIDAAAVVTRELSV
jgi:aminoglycoside phosphotransferase (APT) family kinase protein